MHEVVILPYNEMMDGACMELEESSPQGKAFSLSFVRSTFHARAKKFKDWMIFTAWIKDCLVGITAVAVKPIVLQDQEIIGAFYFDLRVRDEYRRKGIAQKLGWTAKDWALKKNAEFHYLYTIDDNIAMKSLASLVKGFEVGSYDLLIWPVYKTIRIENELKEIEPITIHKEFINHYGPFDLYSNPFEAGDLVGHKISYQTNTAGCSLWSNQGLLEEKINHIPMNLTIIGKISRIWPIKKFNIPHIPRKGEILRSLYVYDFYAVNEVYALSLIQQINNYAKLEGYDYLYIINPPHSNMISYLRRYVPKLFAPKVRYCLLSHTAGILNKIYVDIMDL